MTTYRTYLMIQEESTWKKLIDIKSFPDIGGQPNMIETTTLSDGAQTFESGIIQMGDGLTFTANYSAEAYAKLEAIKGRSKNYAIWFGGTGDSASSAAPDGSNGKISWMGQLTPTISGGGVDEVVEISITISNETVPKWESGSGS